MSGSTPCCIRLHSPCSSGRPPGQLFEVLSPHLKCWLFHLLIPHDIVEGQEPENARFLNVSEDFLVRVLGRVSLIVEASLVGRFESLCFHALSIQG